MRAVTNFWAYLLRHRRIPTAGSLFHHTAVQGVGQFIEVPISQSMLTTVPKFREHLSFCARYIACVFIAFSIMLATCEFGTGHRSLRSASHRTESQPAELTQLVVNRALRHDGYCEV